jgi:putative aldouronate transport system substrate-binding protein
MKHRSLVLACALVVVAALLGTMTSCSDAKGKKHALTSKPVKIRVAFPQNAAIPVKPNTPMQQEVLKKTGIDIEFIAPPGNDYATKMNALYAAKDLPDVFRPFNMTIREMIEDKALLKMKGLIDKHAPVIKKDFATVENLDRTLIDGEIYALAMLRRDENLEKGCIPFIRIDLLKKNGLEKPTTWEGLADTLGKLKKIYPKMIPYGARGDNRVLGIDSISLVPSLGADYNLYRDKSEVWHLGRVEPRYKDAITFLKSLVDKGILDGEYLTTSHQTWIEGLSRGKYMFWYDNPTFAPQVNTALTAIDPDARFEPLPILQNRYGERYNISQPINYLNQFVVSADTKDPVLLVKFLNWMYGDEGMYTANYGMEGVNYTLVDGKPQWTKETLAKYANNENAYYAVLSDLGVGNGYFSLSWLFLSNESFRGARQKNAVDSLYIHDMFKNDPAIHYQSVEPPYSAAEQKRLKDIFQAINDFGRTEYNKFVMGRRPMDQYDKFVADMQSKGTKELVDLVNAAEQRYQASKKK